MQLRAAETVEHPPLAHRARRSSSPSHRSALAERRPAVFDSLEQRVRAGAVRQQMEIHGPVSALLQILRPWQGPAKGVADGSARNG